MNIIIFGPPLAGKGTQSKMIIRDFGLIHLSTGDALRGELERKTELGDLASQYMNKGQLVPDDLVAKVVESFYHENKFKTGILFDGYPRNLEQAKHLLEVILKEGEKIDKIVFLDVPKSELLKRAEKRAIKENREDDKNKDIVLNRIEEFSRFTIPAYNFLKDHKISTIEIDGNQAIESIYKLIKQELTR